jgi:polyhydroxybutyrate depolymerase
VTVLAVLAVLVGVATVVVARRGSGDEALGPVPADPSAGCGSASPVAAGAEALTLDGRTYVREVPPAHDGTTPLPVVVNLHGFAGNALAQADYTALGATGAAEGFVTLTPQGRGDPAAWDALPGSADVAFVGRLLDRAEEDLCLDRNRAYAAGLSNGAMLASTLACVDGDRFAAVGAVAGVSAVIPVGGVPASESCPPGRPVPLVAFHGTDDPVVRFDGGLGPGVADLPAPDGRTIGDVVRRSDMSVAEIMAVWAERDGCETEPAPAVPVEGDVELVAYDCPEGVAVDLYVVDGGGHHWPGATEEPAYGPLADALDELGEPSPVSANDLMWAFFARHPRR